MRGCNCHGIDIMSAILFNSKRINLHCETAFMAMLAIDFGTTNTLAAECVPGARPLPIDPGGPDSQIMKSVFFASSAKEQDWHVGSDAFRAYDECFGEGRYLRSIKKYLPDPSFTGTVVFGKSFSIEQIIGKLLTRVRCRAEEHTGKEFDSAVMGRPGRFSFDDTEDALAQERLRSAARLAGFREVVFCYEPVAVAYKVAAGLHAVGDNLPSSGSGKRGRSVLIVDLGGGTSDFTVCRMGSGRSFGADDVLSVGAISVAGDAFDGALVRHHLAFELGLDVTYQLPTATHAMSLPSAFIAKISSPADFNMLASQQSWQVLEHALRFGKEADRRTKLKRLMILLQDRLGYPFFQEVERVKIELSAKMREKFLFSTLGAEVNADILRADYEENILPMAAKIVETMDATVARSGLNMTQIDQVFCTGGTSRIPAIREALRERFAPDRISDFSTFEGVIQGLSEFGTGIK